MPIGSGAVGGPGVLAIPGDRFLRTRTFRSPPFSTKNPTITGVTKDSGGSAVAAASVKLFRTSNDELVSSTMSDGSGNYTLVATGSGPFYATAYKAGVPDIMGTTVNTLIGV